MNNRYDMKRKQELSGIKRRIVPVFSSTRFYFIENLDIEKGLYDIIRLRY